MKWFRSYHGAPFDIKLATVARNADVTRGNAAAVWWALLDHASQQKPRGSIANIDPEDIAAAFDFDHEKVARVIDAMRQKGMIDDDDMLTAWKQRQPEREDNSRERVTRHRERKRNAVTDDVTQCNAPSNKEGEGEVEEDSSVSSLRSLTGADAPPGDESQNDPPGNPLDIPLILRRPKDGDWRALVFGPAWEWLQTQERSPPKSVLGKWRQLCGEDDEALFGLIARAQNEVKADPVSWIFGQLKPSDVASPSEVLASI